MISCAKRSLRYAVYAKRDRDISRYFARMREIARIRVKTREHAASRGFTRALSPGIGYGVNKVKEGGEYEVGHCFLGLGWGEKPPHLASQRWGQGKAPKD